MECFRGRCVDLQTAIVLWAAILGTVLANPAAAGGFALIGQSARSAGTGYAGASALAGGPDTVHYNPSGMAFLEGRIVSTSADFLFPRSDYTDGGSTDALGLPRIGNDGDGAAIGVVPSSYLILPLSQDVRLGFALNAPYGQSTEYGRAFTGRYEALKSELLVLDASVALSWKLSNNFAIGGGIDFTYADTRLTNAVDFGAVCLGIVGPDCLGLGLAPQAADGELSLEADGFEPGFNLGVMGNFDWGRVGLSFRAPMTISLAGTADFRLPEQAEFLTSTGAFVDTTAETELELPATVSLGAAVNATDELTLLGQVIWTQWSVVDETVVRFTNPLQPDAVLRAEYDDSFYVALGATYAVNDRLTLRGGVAYDQTPLNDRFRVPRLPGASTYSIALGVGYRLTDALTVDLAYQHFFFDDATYDFSDPASGRLVGSTDNASDVVSLQLSLTF
ncbi:MAG: outer membrane protein transport protein [Pseudomonadota bacterium]